MEVEEPGQDPNERLMERQRGLTTEQINKIQIIKVAAENIQEYRNVGVCSICINDFSMRDKVKKLPLCQHPFHEKCIDIWLKRSRECPLCKRSAVTEDALAE